MARTARTLLTFATLAALTAAAGCSRSGEASGTFSAEPSTTASTATRVTSAPGVWKDLDPELQAVMRALYEGGEVPTASVVTGAVEGRTPKAPDASTKVEAATGTWKKVPVATVKVGDDVTLLTEEALGWQVVGGWWPSLGVDGPVMGGKQFVALIGIDRRPHEKDFDTRGDALQVVGYDGKDGAAVLGMARDTWVTLPDGRGAKINDAFDGPGPTGMVAALEKQIGIDIESYAYTDFDRYKKLIDEMGGVTVDNPYEFTRGPNTFKKGRIHLTGSQALTFARERKQLPNSDESRSGNQYQVILGGAIYAKAKGPLGVPPLLAKIEPNIVNDMNAAQALRFFSMPYVIDLAKVGNRVSFGTYGWSPAGASIIVAGSKERGCYADFRDARFDGN